MLKDRKADQGVGFLSGSGLASYGISIGRAVTGCYIQSS